MEKDLRIEIREEIIKEITEKVTDEVTKEVTGKVTKEITEEDIKIVIELCHEYHDTKENAVSKICNKFPEYADQAGELVEKYWERS